MVGGIPRGDERHQGGFAVLEVLIAATFLVTVLVGIGSVLANQMLSVTSSTSWKVGTDLLNQAMEEVRALPATTLSSGLSDLPSCDSGVPGASSPDPNIKVNGSTWTYAPNGETIPHGDLSCTSPQPSQIPPLVPHQSTTTLNHLPFTVAVYPTIPSGTPTGIVRVTAIVSWKRIGLVGVHQVSAQTLVCASACIASGNNVYQGPWQPLFTAGAEAGKGGSIQVTGTVAGVNFDQFFTVLPEADSSLQIQQISTVHGCAVTTGGQAVISGVPQSPSGEISACSAADNDPGSPTTWQTNNAGPQVGGSDTLAGSLLDTLGLTLSGGDAATSTSTVAASGSPPVGALPCRDLAGSTQTNGRPCGSSSSTNAGTATLSAALFSQLLGSLGNAPLLSEGASTSPASSFVGRYTGGSGASSTYCSTPTVTSDDGCVHAGATRSFSLVQLAGLPSGLLGPVSGGGIGLAPLGWALGSAKCPAGNYLVALTNYGDSASAESGIDAVAPIAGTSGSPDLCYWNGSGYSSISAGLLPTSPSLPINNGAVTFTDLSGSVSVSITTNLSLGTVATSPPASSWTANTAKNCWQSPCTASATLTSPVQGSFQMIVSAIDSAGGPLDQLANLTVQVDLGELTASTSYQAAPPQA
jgi:hypothetical protein